MVRAVTRRLAAELGVVYTYDTTEEGKLVNFQQEYVMSTDTRDQIFARLASWDKPGNYHLIGHAAVGSDEVGAMCSVDHPARPWAQTCRVADLDFYLSPVVRQRIGAMGFDLIDVEAVRP
jgi:hypothetical protein